MPRGMKRKQQDDATSPQVGVKKKGKFKVLTDASEAMVAMTRNRDYDRKSEICGGSKGGVSDARPPLAQNFFIFMQFSGKIGQIIGWRPPLWG